MARIVVMMAYIYIQETWKHSLEINFIIWCWPEKKNHVWISSVNLVLFTNIGSNTINLVYSS